MTVKAIKSAAHTSLGAAKETGNKVVNAFGRFFKALSPKLEVIAKKIAEWAKRIFKSFPIYMQKAKDYIKLGINYIKINKIPVGIGTGITLLIGAIAVLIIRFYKPKTSNCNANE